MRCPGQDTQYWKADAISEAQCPECGRAVEFFKDDTTRKCGHCGHRFVNPQMDFGCAAYCQFAEQCLGTLPEELLAEREDLLKDRVAIAVKQYFKTDFKRVGRTLRVARYAEQIGKQIQDNKVKGKLAVIIMAALLQDVGSPGDRQPAGDILTRLNAPDPLVAEVARFLEGLDTSQTEDPSLGVIRDARRLADLAQQATETAPAADTVQAILESGWYTEAGRQAAKTLLKAA